MTKDAAEPMKNAASVLVNIRGKGGKESDASSFPTSTTTTKFFKLNDSFADDGTNVSGRSSWGGSSIKDELYVPEEEEMALVLQGVIDDDDDDDD